MSDDIKGMSDQMLILLNIINDKIKRIEELEQQLAYECECNKQFVECQNKVEELEQQLKELPKKICDEIEKFAYDTYKEFGVFDETDLQHILEEIREKYTKER